MTLYIIYLLMTPVFLGLISICALFSFKIRNNFFHARSTIRLARAKRVNCTKTVLLFHAASAGEFEQLKPILKKIDKEKYFIIQSFTSPTIFNKEKNTVFADVVCYQPFDFIWLSIFFFKYLNPDKYIITRHDLWPNHIITASHMGISCILINANIHNNSIWMHPLLNTLSKKIFNCFDLILVPSNTVKNILQKLDLKSQIKITGDSRFNQIVNRYNMNKNKNLLPNSFKKSTNLIFGSIDAKDEKCIFQAIKKIYPKGETDLKTKNTKIILVPHEIDIQTIKRLSENLKQNNFEYSFLTKLRADTDHGVLIVDKVGLLADLYKYGKVAYIGGGFSRGVHSVIEPAIYNACIGFGPNIEMSDEAKELLKNNFAKSIYDSKDMYDFLNLNYNNKQTLDLHNFIINKAKASEGMLKLILQ